MDTLTGVVLVTHGDHGGDMLRAAAAIVGEIPATRPVSVSLADSSDQMRLKVEQAVRGVDGGEGVLFLVDLHGSTPCNICLSLVDGSRPVEVLCGLNLAMLLKLATCERMKGPRELAVFLQETGRRSIRLGSELTGRITLEELEKR